MTDSDPNTTTQLTDSVLVVIVNYRTGDLTCDCLCSLHSELKSMPNLQVVVTDNLSGDESVPQIEATINTENLRDRVSMMPLEKNGGFAYGNNGAIRPALESAIPPKYVLLLNPDTVVRPNAITELVRFMNANPKAGLAGSRLEDPDGTPQRSAFRFPGVRSEFERNIRWGLVSKVLKNSIVAPAVVDEDSPTDWVAGASMIVRREVFEDIGLLDENYFMYFEEVDFCLRAAKAGWPCWYVPSSHVVHLVGQASGVTNKHTAPTKRRPDYWFESRRRYFVQNRGRLHALGCDLASLTGLTIWKMRRWVQRKPEVNPPRILWDSFRNSVFIKGFSA